MRILANFFNIRPDAPVHDQAVIIDLGRAGATEITRLHSALVDRVRDAALGEIDPLPPVSHTSILLLFGPDAERLFAGIRSTLAADPAGAVARVTVRCGGPGAPERVIDLGAM
jgi:hypothetical protein